MSNLYGEILLWAGEFSSKNLTMLEQLGFLPCNGSLVEVAKYKALADVIGDRFSSEEGTPPGYVRLPDLQGRTAVGAGEGKGLTARKIGEKAGAEMHKLTIGEMPSHSHSVNFWRGNDGNRSGHQDALYSQTAAGTGLAGEDKPHNNMQPFLALNYVIRYRL